MKIINLINKIIRKKVKYMNFGEALEKLKQGMFIFRKGWNGKNQRLKLQVPDENSKMTLPYIYIMTVQGELVPWLASQTDILADDWFMGEAKLDELPLDETKKEVTNDETTKLPDYSNLINREGTVYAGDKAFANPAELAEYLGVAEDKIDWKQIQEDNNKSE